MTILDVAHQVSVRLRRQLERVRPAALLRNRVAAAQLGVGFAIEEEGKSIRLTRGERHMLIQTHDTGLIWEAVHAFDYFWDAVLPKRVDGHEEIDLRGSRTHTLRRSGLEMEFTAQPETDDVNEIYLDLGGIKPGHVVLDCGAYCGGSSMAMSKVVGPSGRVVAFEPDARNRGALERNLAAHRVENVTVVPKGIWSRTTTIAFYEGGHMGSRIVEDAEPAPRVATAPVTSLVDAVRDNDLARVDFVKMDIEGAEVPALEAARDWIREAKPRFVVEAHTIDGEPTAPKIVEIFRSCGLRTKLLHETFGAGFYLVFAHAPDARI